MSSQILLYQNPDGNIGIDVRLEEDTVWLTQEQMATLFGKAKSTINEHIKKADVRIAVSGEVGGGVCIKGASKPL